MSQLRDEKFLTAVSWKIKTIREQKGITLEQFYFDTGIHLARIEQGKSNITVGTLKEICKYFNVSLKDFFDDL